MGLNKEALLRILQCASEAGISDVHIAQNQAVYWRRGEILSALNEYVPSENDIHIILQTLVKEELWEQLAQLKTVNCTYQLDEWRYRVHAYKKGGRIAFAIRILPRQIPEITQLGQASLIKRFAAYKQGLLLVTGATGAGKSTTVAAFLEYLNQQENLHILTLEDPIEFLYSSSHSLISQLELGEDFHDYGQAVNNAMREAPNVIMVSEMRNKETVQAVLNASVSGHLVVATMHAGNASEAIERLVSMYPLGQQNMAQSLLSASLIGVCSQRLLAGKGGRRYCAMECLYANQAAKNIIRQGKYEQLHSIMQSGMSEGMQTMEMGIAALRRNNLLKWERGKELSVG